jgi:hypothetical protein
MKVRRREVNIFNMSLLDILCGALGAFCFMMLALFPAYIEAQKHKASPDAEERARLAEERAERAEQQARQEKVDQTFLAFRLHWNTTDDVDMWISGPDNTWWGPKEQRLPPGGRLVSKTPDVTDGTQRAESFWIWNAATPNAVYRFYGEVAARRGSSGPIAVRSYSAFRWFNDKGDKAMGMPEVSYSSLTVDGERVELGVLTFDDKGNFVKFEWTNRSNGPPGGS